MDDREHSRLQSDFEPPQRTAAQLADLIAQRIITGQYAAGDTLPSCREQARDLHMHKNTVNKAYRLLEKRGLVNTVVGKGVFVTGPHGADTFDGNQVQEGIDAAIWQARAFGTAENELWQLVADAVWKYYGATQAQLVLIECNEWEALNMAQQLESHLHFPVKTALLPEFLSNAEYYADAFDLVVTTLHHLSVVRGADASTRNKAIGLHSLPIVENMLQIAEAKKGTIVGVVCSTEPSVSTLTGLVSSYNADIVVYSHLMTDRAELAQFITQVDLIVDTMSTHKVVHELAPKTPAITVAFKIDEQSIEFLKLELLKLVKQRVKQSSAAVSPADRTQEVIGAATP
jgi:DNA-binding transcriptional regulator YhcF (GntR family)